MTCVKSDMCQKRHVSFVTQVILDMGTKRRRSKKTCVAKDTGHFRHKYEKTQRPKRRRSKRTRKARLVPHEFYVKLIGDFTTILDLIKVREVLHKHQKRAI